jgi:hypothetical protein
LDNSVRTRKRAMPIVTVIPVSNVLKLEIFNPKRQKV